MLKNGFLLLAFLFFFQGIQAQNFPKDPEKFIKEVEKYFGSFNKAKAKEFVDKYETFWLEEFPDDKRNTVINAMDLIQLKRLRALPDAYAYLVGAMEVIKQGYPDNVFVDWHKMMSELAEEKNPRNFKEFVVQTGLLFGYNTFHSSRSVNWNVRCKNYTFTKDRRIFINFENADLIGLDKNDSIVIRATSGSFDVLTKGVEGKGGIVNWEKVGLDPAKTYAEISNYKFNVRSTSLRSDSVIMHTTYFEEPLIGELTDGTFNHNSSVAYPFPQFKSYSSKLKVNNILPDIHYVGGFTLKGAAFVGAGSGISNASLVFERGSLPFIKVTANLFTITDKNIYAENAKMSMSIGEIDSITHPGINVNYKIQEEELELYRGQSGVSQTPFKNSYHQLDMYCDRLVWNKQSPQIRVTYTKNASRRLAFFESTTYYSQKLYDQLQGLEKVHPLVSIHNYAYKYDEYVIDEGKVASFLGRSIQQAKPQLLQLSSYGFITYDTQKGLITVLPKLENYILNRSGNKDYDNLVFVSDLNEQSMPTTDLNGQEIKKDSTYYAKENQLKVDNLKNANTDNATLDLQNMDLLIRGTRRVTISNNQNVEVYPSDDQVLVKKDRDFLFKGYLNAGKAEILLREGSFDYSEFKVNLMDVEFMRFRVNPIFNPEEKRQKRMTSLIENLKGYVLVDDTTNRAGIDTAFTDFPKIKSFKNSNVFYEYNALYKRAYDSADFYFDAEPFEIDSLDNFYEPTLALKGEMHTAGIFPTFKEDLKIQPDYSFGFKRNAPADGFDFYGTGAKYDNEIRLSNAGLQGSGTINFITSTAVSNSFTFLPDSTLGVAQDYHNVRKESEKQYPQAEGKDVFITYVPHENILKAKSLQTPITMFEDEAKIKGQLYVQPEGMTGRGFMEFENATLDSKKFKFKADIIDSDTANFDLKSMDSDDIAFKTYNVNAHVSFKERKGEFKTNGEESYVEFPDNQYICYMDKFNWYMDSEDIELEKEKQDIAIETDLDLAGSNFFSIHPDQDSLNFMAPKAKFSLKEKTIRCAEVKYVDVADSRIFPDSSKLTIRKKAKIDPLENSEIVANYITKYHKIINATTKIAAKNEYESEGDYAYIDADKKEFIIHMDKIYVDTTLQTKAIGKVAKDQDFRLSAQFDFYGDVQMAASEEFMTFSGATKIIHDCDVFEKNWMSFTAAINPMEIYIPVGEEIVDLDKNAIAAGIAFNASANDSIGTYPTFLSKKQDKNNEMVITANGVLFYDIAAKEFQISNKEKLIERSRPGNFISLHTESCSMNGNGNVSFAADLGGAKMSPFGFVDYNMNNKFTTIRWAGPTDFFFDEKTMDIIAEKINKVVDLETMDLNLSPFYQSVQEYTDVKTADKVKSDIPLGKYSKAPKEMQVPFYFGDVKFKTAKEEGIFYYISENKVGIANMYGIPILKYVPGNVIVEVNRIRNYNILHVFLEPPGGKYYYFRIAYDNKKNTEMQIFTNDNDVKASLEAIKDDKKKDKNFEYYIGENSVYFSQFKRLLELK